MGWVDGVDLDERGRQEPLDLCHRRHQAGHAADSLSGCRKRARQLVAAPLEKVSFGASGRRQPRDADALVRRERRHGDEPGVLEGSQQAAEIARVELEPSSQPAHLASFGADLPQHTRLSERAVPGEIVVVERTDTLGDQPVEAAHLTDGRGRHSLILVRESRSGKTCRRRR